MRYELCVKEHWLSKPEFGKKLRALIARNGLLQCQLYRQLGCQRQTLAGWLGGQHYPDRYFREELAKIFGLTVIDLMSKPLESGEGEGR